MGCYQYSKITAQRICPMTWSTQTSTTQTAWCRARFVSTDIPRSKGKPQCPQKTHSFGWLLSGARVNRKNIHRRLLDTSQTSAAPVRRILPSAAGIFKALQLVTVSLPSSLSLFLRTRLNGYVRGRERSNIYYSEGEIQLVRYFPHNPFDRQCHRHSTAVWIPS